MTPISTLCDPGDRCRQSDRCARAQSSSPDAELVDGSVLLRTASWCPMFLDLRGAALRRAAIHQPSPTKRDEVTA